MSRNQPKPHAGKKSISSHPSRTNANPAEICNFMLDKYHKSQNDINEEDHKLLLYNMKIAIESNIYTDINEDILEHFIKSTFESRTSFNLDEIEIFLTLLSIDKLTKLRDIEFLKILISEFNKFCLKNIFTENNDIQSFNIINIMPSLYNILTNWPDLDESILKPLSSTIIRLFYCNQSSVVLQRSTATIICLIFHKNLGINQDIIQEIIFEGKKTINEKKTITIIADQNEKVQVSLMSYFLIEIIQISENPDDSYGQSDTICKNVISKLIENFNPQNKIFEKFSKDVSLLLYHPNFPVCELIARNLLIGSMTMIEMKEVYIQTCLNVISELIKAVSKGNKLQKEEVFISFPMSLIDKSDETVLSLYKNSEFPSNTKERDIAIYILLSFCHKTESNSFLYNKSSVDYLMSYLSNKTEKNELKKIYDDATRNDDYSFPFDYSLIMSVSLFKENEMNLSLKKLIDFISKFNTQMTIKNRLTIIKTIADLTSIDRTFLGNPNVIKRIEASISDISPSVREKTIEILSNLLTNDEMNEKYFDCIILSLKDKSPSVISTALSVLMKQKNIENQNCQIIKNVTVLLDSQSSIVRKRSKDLIKKLFETNPILTFSNILIQNLMNENIQKIVNKMNLTELIVEKTIDTFQENVTLEGVKTVDFISTHYEEFAVKYKYCDILMKLHNEIEIEDDRILSLLSESISNLLCYNLIVDQKLAKETLKKSIFNLQKSVSVDVIFSESKLSCFLEENILKKSDITKNIVNKLLQFLDNKNVSKRSILIIGGLGKFTKENDLKSQIFQKLKVLYENSDDKKFRSIVLKSLLSISTSSDKLLLDISKIMENALFLSEEEIVESIEYFGYILEHDNDENSFVSIIPRLYPQILKIGITENTMIRTKTFNLISKCLERGILLSFQVSSFLVSLIFFEENHFEVLNLISKMNEKDQKFVVSSILSSIDSTIDLYKGKFSVFDIFHVLSQKNKNFFFEDLSDFFYESINLQKEQKIVSFVVNQLTKTFFAKEESEKILQITKNSSLSSQIFQILRESKKQNVDYNSIYICCQILYLKYYFEGKIIDEPPTFDEEKIDILKKYISMLMKQK
ncbi:hypothetical protein TVAG_310270 [Trichomonas vaginalis G3]|uniref:Condensin complex subunit 1 C-terminal domain-containing protein n=1 Tax=Trichomonas vaginalis (strain ATCC PRA-98 / G3) TaxID=412133 RepID=A2EKU3_TRIV3|nr:armadillo (ARM) repeat-containing protein family [Trichomonas vaginalis G3]EAY06740.1 hypothetical protein TVAG_310270 [Trichomonas vaginalis G3]KAI5500968.1 armadillo (ARM) repeat-containing protein family [Trichomonas vaginalis G3]|eukprot:XP_001318963.1 hypothetical protein [Trichomonas vaginalis G3]